MGLVIVTGGTSGIGKAVAAAFLSIGKDVVICARNNEKLNKTEAEWHLKFPTRFVKGFQLDMSDAIQVQQFVQSILALNKPIDVLVNNAGIFHPGALMETSDELFEQTMLTNLFSAFWITKGLMATLKAQQKGHIFNICSVASLKAYAGGGAYGVSKYALLGFSDNLRMELITDKIKVTAVCPGATYSASWDGVTLPENHLMDAEDVAQSIVNAYSLSERANVDNIILRPLKGDL